MRRLLIRIIYFILFLYTQLAYSQNNYNLNFEMVGKGHTAIGWDSIIFANDRPYYTFLLDSITVQKEKYAFSIVSDTFVTEGNSAYCKYILPINFLRCFCKSL